MLGCPSPSHPTNLRCSVFGISQKAKEESKKNHFHDPLTSTCHRNEMISRLALASARILDEFASDLRNVIQSRIAVSSKVMPKWRPKTVAHGGGITYVRVRDGPFRRHKRWPSSCLRHVDRRARRFQFCARRSPARPRRSSARRRLPSRGDPGPDIASTPCQVTARNSACISSRARRTR